MNLGASQTCQDDAAQYAAPPDSRSLRPGALCSRRRFVSLAALAGGVVAVSRVETAEARVANPPITTGYASVNGLDLYYEIHGQGEPVVLLHGAFETIDVWGDTLAALALSRQVIAVDLQGHGRTADSGRPFSYEALADDVAGLLDDLEFQQADVVGYSLGGNTALQVAIRHSERVRKLVAISATYRSDGEYPEVLAGIEFLTPEFFAGTPVEEVYLRTAPRPEDFPAFVEKLKAFMLQEFAFAETDIAAITAPALLLMGDSDTVRPEHAVEMFRLLGGGVPGDLTGLPESRFAVLPATTHASIMSTQSAVTLPMIEAFLDAPPTNPS